MAAIKSRQPITMSLSLRDAIRRAAAMERRRTGENISLASFCRDAVREKIERVTGEPAPAQ